MHVHVDYADICVYVFLDAEFACRFLYAVILFQWAQNQPDVPKSVFPLSISDVPVLCT